VFLIGGPAFSGTTLLALLLNQDGIVCLDEPDFHDPEQAHRGLPFLRELFPDTAFPAGPGRALSWEEATCLIEDCERAISPVELGIKTCNAYFLGYGGAYRRRGYPVVAIFRDIRDALVAPLPPWQSEQKLNGEYRRVWAERESFDLWFRYEELVTGPEAVLARVGAALGLSLDVRARWAEDRVSPHMLKLDRHQLLRAGSISSSRVGIWRGAERSFSPETHETARLMGYAY
jgi:hypothetical protein